MASPGVQKSLERVHAQVAAGAAYEAQQMYKTIYHRCRARKQGDDALAVLGAGAVTQLRAGQLNCGMELANMLVEAYKADNVPGTAAQLEPLFAILQALPSQPAQAEGDSAGELEEASRFVMAALKWANSKGAGEAVQRLHDLFASWVWVAFGWRHFSKAALHFSRGGDAGAYAAALAGVAQLAGSEEAPLLVARAVLQTLACARAATTQRQLAHAQALLAACTAQLPGAADAPLVHFAGLLLQALSLHKHALLTLLQSRYEPSLAADPSFDAYLTSIEATYFNIRPPNGGGGGLLGSLLRGLLEGDELDA